MLFEWFNEHEFHFKEHDDRTIQSSDQATPVFKGHMHSNALRHNQVIMGSSFWLVLIKLVRINSCQNPIGLFLKQECN